MRKTLLCVIAFVWGATAIYSQAYISVSGGYGFKAHEKTLGRDATGCSGSNTGMLGTGRICTYEDY